eukprot:Phypoly_transcript_18431.p1 GENE.Phypoly_transcript_18431~~Phypoly_transcript_18431.p1  ORF type:complete len:197 (+),score=7.84 Phypoly_transcript_18431:26-592(+)
MRPPGDPLALEKLLGAMIPSKDRFVNTTYVQFKNHLFSDESIQLTTQLFPALEKLALDGGKITKEGIIQVKNLRKLRFLWVNCKRQFSWDTNEWLQPMESHLERLHIRGKFNPLFMKKCVQCHLFYNPKFNTNRSCLYHPGEYSGYGHSCSSSTVAGVTRRVTWALLVAHMARTLTRGNPRIYRLTGH